MSLFIAHIPQSMICIFQLDFTQKVSKCSKNAGKRPVVAFLNPFHQIQCLISHMTFIRDIDVCFQIHCHSLIQSYYLIITCNSLFSICLCVLSKCLCTLHQSTLYHVRLIIHYIYSYKSIKLFKILYWYKNFI